VAPFFFDSCPRCAARTRQRFLAENADDTITTICATCFAVLTHRADGSAECRDATAEERATVPPPVIWSEHERAEWQELLRQGRADLKAWVQSGCPGLTPELEQAFPPGAMDRVRRFVEQIDERGSLERPADPDTGPDRGGM
jgi:hypothetical protein